jgi:competence ComEA-like helix-hairpin-helix protein
MLLALVGLGGLGLAAGNWRRAHPDLTERIERFDAGYVIDPAIQPLPDAPPVDGARPPVDGTSPRESDEVSAPEAVHRDRTAEFRAESPLDLNRATAGDLERLPGIGPGLAARIVAARETAGRFQSVDDLRRVPGLGRMKLGRLRDLVTVATD